MSDSQNVLRLRKKHGSGAGSSGTAANGGRLVAAQSLRNAIVAGLIAVIVFSALWATLSSLTNRVYPWMTIVLGYLLGFAVRQAGRGVDWRFPLVAALLALGGALLSNIVVAATVTAESHGTGTLQILQGVTTMTWPVYFNEVLNAADVIYALFAASVAAFFAKRRLTRSQYYSLRLWGEEQHNHR